jgi:hypothetical protein
MSDTQCRICKQTLTTHERVRGTLCDRMDCRRRATNEAVRPLPPLQAAQAEHAAPGVTGRDDALR